MSISRFNYLYCYLKLSITHTYYQHGYGQESNQFKNFKWLCFYNKYMKWGRLGAGAHECNCNATIMGSIPTWGNKLLFINIFISFLWHQGKTRRRVPKVFVEKWATECLNTMFSLPSLLCAGHSVKLFFLYEMLTFHSCFILETESIQNIDLNRITHS